MQGTGPSPYLFAAEEKATHACNAVGGGDRPYPKLRGVDFILSERTGSSCVHHVCTEPKRESYSRRQSANSKFIYILFELM